MKVIRAKVAGFCFGVERAVRLAREAQGKCVQTLGELIHNPEVLEELENRGINSVAAVAELQSGTVIIRAHGISDQKRAELAEKEVQVVDASCPFVQRLHTAVGEFIKKNRLVVILGRRDHPEMVAVIEDYPAVVVVESATDPNLKKLASQKVGVLAQTTETAENFAELLKRLTELGMKVEPAFTICNATNDRQKAALKLAKEVDAMIVIGGKNSNNTKKLWQLTSEICPSHWIESEEELELALFQGMERVGVTAGASTPENQIEQVIKYLEKLDNL